MPITDPTEAYFKDGGWAWDGSQWRKQPFVFGFSDKLRERVSDTNADAGTNQLNGAAVPAGEIWIVMGASVVDADNAPTSQHIRVQDGTVYCILANDTAPAALDYLCWSGFIVLVEGDLMNGTLYGCTAGDDLYLDYWGVKMSIVE